MFTAVSLFSWIVVFTFRKNMLMETQINRRQSRRDDIFSANIQPPSAPDNNAPPPSYYETEGYKDCKPPAEEAPPEYEEAVSMLAGQGGEGAVKGPVLRKKSLTTNII